LSHSNLASASARPVGRYRAVPKPAGIMRCNRLILRRRNRSFLPFRKQALLEEMVPCWAFRDCRHSL
jgi:hypothetical protein